ncbi:MAG: hypothetical protein IJ620_00280 [Bacteroidales bacterium]|nr:hypothetical protein [Bacteroidales bacterium]
MSRNLFIIILVCLLSGCMRHVVTEEAREQARQSEGVYDVAGSMTLAPFQNETEPRTITYSGTATATDLGDAIINVAYISDKTPDTVSIQVEMDGEGNLLFKNFSVNVFGVDASAHMRQSQIRRYGEDTVRGTAECTLTIFLYSRDCELEVNAVRRPVENLDGH